MIFDGLKACRLQKFFARSAVRPQNRKKKRTTQQQKKGKSTNTTMALPIAPPSSVLTHSSCSWYQHVGNSLRNTFNLFVLDQTSFDPVILDTVSQIGIIFTSKWAYLFCDALCLISRDTSNRFVFFFYALLPRQQINTFVKFRAAIIFFQFFKNHFAKGIF